MSCANIARDCIWNTPLDLVLKFFSLNNSIPSSHIQCQ
jgi:hypothetical protein